MPRPRYTHWSRNRKPVIERPESQTHRIVELLDAQPVWMAEGACQGRMDDFDLPHNLKGKERKEKIEKAKGLCAGCPVLAECKIWAEALEQKAMATNDYAERWQWTDIVVAGKYYPETRSKT